MKSFMNNPALIITLSASLALGCSNPKRAEQENSTSINATRTDSLSENEVAQILGYHNTVRSDVNVGPLRWSDSLAKFADSWANTLAKTKCTLEHRSDSPYGENLYIGTATHYGVVDAGKAWENEKQHYGGSKLTESNWYDSGHYTQMVWRNTREVGCAKSICSGNMIVVCNYNPPGNYLGEMPY